MHRKRKPFNELSYRQKKRIVAENVRSALNDQTVDNEHSVGSGSDINNEDGCHSSPITVLTFKNKSLTESVNVNAESNKINSSNNQIDNGTESNICSSPDITLFENYKTFLRQWVCKHNVSKVAVNDPLGFLKKCDDNNLKELPTDVRTLMETPRTVMTIIDMCGGKYIHFALEYGLACCIQNNYWECTKKS